MGFGPWLSKEEKNRLNADMRRTQQKNQGLVSGGPGEMITPAERARRIQAASPEGMGLAPKQKVRVGGRSAIKAEERRRSTESAKTPFVPPAPSESTRKPRKGNQARPSGGVTIGIPQSSPISTQRPNRSSSSTKPSTSTTTEEASVVPERPTTPGNKGAETAALGGENYTVMGVEYDYKTGQAINPDTGKISSGGYSIDPKTSARTDYSRGQTRIDSRGNIQTGTQTSLSPMTMEDANSLLSGGYTVQSPFSSTQLPASSQSPYANVGPIADGAEYARNLEMQKPGAVTGVGPISDGENYAKNVEAGEQTTLKPSDTGTDWLNRSAADNSDPNMARRRAFLDAEGSMQGLRRAESTQGIVYAGGQHHMVNPNAGQEGQNDFVSIGDKDDVRGYKSGRLSAQDMKDKYVTKIKDNGITSYDEDKVTDTAGPLADADAYGAHLQTQQDKYKTSGIGPLADGDAYAKMLRR